MTPFVVRQFVPRIFQWRILQNKYWSIFKYVLLLIYHYFFFVFLQEIGPFLKTSKRFTKFIIFFFFFSHFLVLEQEVLISNFRQGYQQQMLFNQMINVLTWIMLMT